MSSEEHQTMNNSNDNFSSKGGDPSAMFTVGTWIYSGRSGKERNLDESFRWQKLAADAGHPGATFNIGDTGFHTNLDFMYYRMISRE